jgi:murein DD-endopeptidase MepM/ murein hydrolase activator NlpD
VRSFTASAVALMVVGSLAGSALGAPLVQQAERRQARVQRSIERTRETRWEVIANLRAEIAQAEGVLRRANQAPGKAHHPGRFKGIVRHAEAERRSAAARLWRYERFSDRRRRALQTRNAEITSWLSVWGVFRVCPVGGTTYVHDDFGAMRRIPGVPVHRHMGNDIMAPTGAPIYAPFDGYAYASSSRYGGYEVRVRGVRGYTYNAHLSSYGRLGYVKAGTVVGYVGSTGDATAPHLHFEWHPYGGGAVDPNALLSVVC